MQQDFNETHREEEYFGACRVNLPNAKYLEIEAKFTEKYNKGELDEISVDAIEIMYGQQKGQILTFRSLGHMRRFADLLRQYADFRTADKQS